MVANKDTWDQYLPLVEFAYNNSINPSTGFTPFYLVYGREVASPIARMSEALDSQPASMPVADMLTHWQGALRQARQRLCNGALVDPVPVLPWRQESMLQYAYLL